MKKNYVTPEVEIYTALVEQPFMSLSTVKFGDVTNGGENTDENGVLPVSYTHLDVYKRQLLGRSISVFNTTTN